MEISKVAEKIVGKTYEEASKVVKENNYIIRKTFEDGEAFMVTMDYRTDRINVAIDNGIVTSTSFG